MNDSFKHLRLKVDQTPRFPFAQTWFSLRVHIVNAKGVVVSIGVPLQLELWSEGLPAEQNLFEIREPAAQFVNGTSRVEVKFLKSGNRNYNWKFSCTLPNGLVLTLLAEPMKPIEYRVTLQGNIPERFYKDSGGKGKLIALQGKICDRHGKPPTKATTVPLEACLMYENYREVMDQSIFKVKHCGHDDKGVVFLSFRIEDVSKNHQSQAFRVRVQPMASCPANLGVAWDFTTPVTVFSKVNRRDRRKRKASQDTSDSDCGSPPFQPLDTPPQPTSPLRTTVPPPASTGFAHLNALTSFAVSSYRALVAVEWQIAGYQQAIGADEPLPIYRCPGCWAHRSDANDTLKPVRLRNETHPTNDHNPNCVIHANLDNFRKNISSVVDLLGTPGRAGEVDQETETKKFKSQPTEEPNEFLPHNFTHQQQQQYPHQQAQQQQLPQPGMVASSLTPAPLRRVHSRTTTVTHEVYEQADTKLPMTLPSRPAPLDPRLSSILLMGDGLSMSGIGSLNGSMTLPRSIGIGGGKTLSSLGIHHHNGMMSPTSPWPSEQNISWEMIPSAMPHKLAENNENELVQGPET